MSVRKIALAAALSVAGATTGCSCGKEAAPPPATVTIRGRTWTVELAMDYGARYQGLSDRFKLPDGAGMLFIYPQPQVLSFCMRNCYVPLDIAFLDANGTVVRTYTMRTEPRGHEVEEYSSEDPAVYALEMNAGDLRKAGAKDGDQAEFSNVPGPAKAQADPRR